VGIGILDRPAEIRPTMHQCEADRLSWLNIADDLPRFETNENISHPRERMSPTDF
jgi:hypothetical protein